MARIISFMHISLDGFVAGPNGEMDWIKIDEQIFDHVGERISKGHTALYGRVTYEMMERYWPTAAEKPSASRHDIRHSKWYRQVRKVVLSNNLVSDPARNLTVLNDNLPERLEKIKQEAGEEMLLFGSPGATHSMIQLDMIDGYWLFVNPVILGKGISLFTDLQHKTKLDLLSTRQFSCGVVELDYTVIR